MAKAIKQAQKPVSPVALAVRTATDSLALTFQHSAMVAQSVAVENASIAGETLCAIRALRDVLSGAEYLAAVVAIFGTSGVHHSKPEYQPGALRKELEKRFETDAKATGEESADYLNRIKFRLSQARSVASWLADPVNYAKASTPDEDGDAPTLGALDKLRKGSTEPRAPKVATPDAPSDAVQVTAASALAAMVAQFGFPAMCTAFADALNDKPGAKLTAAGLQALAKAA